MKNRKRRRLITMVSTLEKCIGPRSPSKSNLSLSISNRPLRLKCWENHWAKADKLTKMMKIILKFLVKKSSNMTNLGRMLCPRKSPLSETQAWTELTLTWASIMEAITREVPSLIVIFNSIRKVAYQDTPSVIKVLEALSLSLIDRALFQDPDITSRLSEGEISPWPILIIQTSILRMKEHRRKLTSFLSWEERGRRKKRRGTPSTRVAKPNLTDIWPIMKKSSILT